VKEYQASKVASVLDDEKKIHHAENRAICNIKDKSKNRPVISESSVSSFLALYAAASDKVSQLLAHGRWFSPGTPASSTKTKTGRHDIAEILMKVALSTKNKIKSNLSFIILNSDQ
jgi:hypothetical protein